MSDLRGRESTRRPVLAAEHQRVRNRRLDERLTNVTVVRATGRRSGYDVAGQPRSIRVRTL
jgi:hypothetical protein